MKVTVSRKAHFNAAHRLYRKDWSDEQNDAIFGKCSNPNFHGHNYELIVSVTGPIDPNTGYVMDMKVLKDYIKSEVEDAFDHKNLNIEVPEFADTIPTAESKELMWEYYAGLYEEDRNTNFFVTTDIDEAIFLADRLLIMTSLPTSTRSVIEIDIPRPRNIEAMADSKQANDIKTEVMTLLHEEAMKSFSKIHFNIEKLGDQ